MSKLRNDKAELEDKIQDLEARISQQNQAMGEMERRLEVQKRESNFLKEKFQKEDDNRERTISLPFSSDRDVNVTWTFTSFPPVRIKYLSSP